MAATDGDAPRSRGLRGYFIGRSNHAFYPRDIPEWWSVICDRIAAEDAVSLSIDLRQDGSGEPISRECFKSFCRKLEHTKSIEYLTLRSDCLYDGDVFQWLGGWFEKCPNLKDFSIQNDPAFADASNAFAEMLLNRTNRSLTNIYLNFTGISNASVRGMVAGFRACPSLELLDLDSNDIGATGCFDLAAWLRDPACRLKKLGVWENPIGNEGTMELIASLKVNKALKTLSFDARPVALEFDEDEDDWDTWGQWDDDIPRPKMLQDAKDSLLQALCCTTSINATFSSNHTVEKLYDPELAGIVELDFERYGLEAKEIDNEVNTYLQLNQNANKAQVAIQKILMHHDTFDVEPLFEWDLKVLPYMLRWYGRAKECPDADERDINTRTLSAVFQFARSMPLMFMPGRECTQEMEN